MHKFMIHFTTFNNAQINAVENKVLQAYYNGMSQIKQTQCKDSFFGEKCSCDIRRTVYLGFVAAREEATLDASITLDKLKSATYSIHTMSAETELMAVCRQL